MEEKGSSLINYIIAISIIFIGLSVWIYLLLKEVNVKKNTEKKLLNEKYHLYDLHKYALIGHWEILADGTTLWSEDMYQLFDLPHKKDKPASKPFASLLNSSDLRYFTTSIKHCFTTKRFKLYK